MIRIIPAIDLIDGKCVRLQKGDYSTKKIYNEDPLEVAKSFEAHGIKHLHLVDLDGAKTHEIINHKVLESIAKNTSLNIDFGGGIKSTEMLQIAFDCGANQVSIGSLAVKDPALFFDCLKTFGSKRIILSADAMNKKIATNGWLEDSGIDLIPFLAKYYTKGVKYATVTDISKDGMLEGSNRALYQEIASEINDLNLIVSGGIKDIEDVEELALDNFFGVIIGKAIYEGKIDLKDLERFVI